MTKSLRMRGAQTCAPASDPLARRTVAPLATACAVSLLAGSVAAQDATDGVIVLPTVDVQTTEAPAPAPVRSAPAPRRTTVARQAPAAPQVCTPELAGTPVCAAEEAAEAERLAAEAAAAEAARQASAGTNPNADPDAPFKINTLTNSKLIGDVADMPRTVTAISKETLETTQTTSIREIARHTPGMSLGFGEGGNAYGDNIYIRGF
ncbi:MAG: TonB-dependent receptor plug domain-containing protein, partial [Pseudomonadota bacterium]|nr:TonB-dependent receptor plug domain-containing protein [Pseudomonadota bacterium]